MVRLRQEAAAFAEAANTDLAALVRQGEMLIEATDLGARRPERERHLREGARVVMLHLANQLTEASAAYERGREMLAAWLPKGEWTAGDQPAPLTAAEAAILRRWRETHVQRLNRDAGVREFSRLARGGGPPRAGPAPEKHGHGVSTRIRPQAVTARLPTWAHRAPAPSPAPHHPRVRTYRSTGGADMHASEIEGALERIGVAIDDGRGDVGEVKGALENELPPAPGRVIVQCVYDIDEMQR